MEGTVIGGFLPSGSCLSFRQQQFLPPWREFRASKGILGGASKGISGGALGGLNALLVPAYPFAAPIFFHFFQQKATSVD